MFKSYRRTGVSITLIWVVLITAFLISRRENPFALPLNEFGDFLAGTLAPLGIFWIILGFWQQGDELRSSVDALRLQSVELKNAVDQQKALVDISQKRAETELLAVEQDLKNAKRARSPIFLVRKGGGSSLGNGNLTLHFLIRNSGAECSNFKIIDIETDNTLFHEAHFHGSDEKRISIKALKHENWTNKIIELSCQTIDGDSIHELYALNRETSDKHVFSEISKISK